MTNGGLNHVMWHCSGLADFTNGLGQAAGFCAGNDPVGDQVVLTGSQRNPDQKVVRGTIQLTVAPRNTLGSAVTKRMWIIRANSDH